MKEGWAKCHICHRQFDVVGGNFDPNVGPAPYCEEQSCPFRAGPPRDRDKEVTRRIKTPSRPMEAVTGDEEDGDSS